MGAHRAMGVRSGAPFPAAVHSFDLPHLHDPAAVRRMPGSAPTNEFERIGAAHWCGLSLDSPPRTCAAFHEQPG